MQRHLIAAAAVLILSTPGLALAESKTLDVKDFAGLDIASGIRAEAIIGSTFSIVAESPDAAELRDLRYTVTNGTFRAWYDWDIFNLFRPSGRNVTLHITLPRLDHADVSAGANLIATAPVGDDLSLDASSGAHATITAATAKTYSVDVSSGANLEASKLDCAEASANVSSGGNATVSARAEVTVDASSGGAVKVLGHPTVKTLDSNSGARVTFDE